MQYPGRHGKLPVVEEMHFAGISDEDLFPIYRGAHGGRAGTGDPPQSAAHAARAVMDEDGAIREGAQDPNVDKDTALKIYQTMCQLQAMDNVFYDAQRQVRAAAQPRSPIRPDPMGLLFFGPWGAGPRVLLHDALRRGGRDRGQRRRVGPWCVSPGPYRHLRAGADPCERPADDEVFGQYREAGVLMWRGFSLQQCADQVSDPLQALSRQRSARY